MSDGVATVDTSVTGNPSRRRHGLKIYFWCEGCSSKSELSVSQHKGVTSVNFNNINKEG